MAFEDAEAAIKTEREAILNILSPWLGDDGQIIQAIRARDQS